MAQFNEWTKEEADETYLISEWGDGFFDVNEKGHLCVLPEKDDKGPSIDIAEVIEEMKEQGIQFPAVIRFNDILRSQVRNLNETFREVIEEAQYPASYMGVYPIKVNQMREVVEEIVDAGGPYSYGLEAGSKAEILSVLALNTNTESLTILNGYKDEDFLRLALLARKLGRKAIVVIEKLSELTTLLRLAKEENIDPLIGFRAKMSIKGEGKWCDSSGDRAKFGLTVAEMIKALEMLKSNGLENSLKLFHFHIGSQITDIRTIKEAIAEGTRIYANLVKMGAPLEYLDVGGGLGVDYDGSKSTNLSSKNYNVAEYASDIVYGIKQACELEKINCPTIVSESGRAITAHHSCVICEVIDKIETSYVDYNTDPEKGEYVLVNNMREILGELDEENFQEMYNDAVQVKSDTLDAFKFGVITLNERAKVETLYWKITKKIRNIISSLDYVPEGLQDLEELLSPQYLCNFSVFQSTADSWAIGQLLPVVPITRLNEKPTNYSSIVDITCDSDGRIKNYINREEPSKTVQLHELKSGEDYFVGLFLTGAYQDVMGDMHNLFGRLNEVHVYCDDDDPTDFYIEEVIKGSSAEMVLSTMQYNPEFMAFSVKKSIDQMIQKGKIIPREGVRLVDFYEKCLKSYTYLS